MQCRLVFLPVVGLISLLTIQSASTQANLDLYTDNLVNGFQNWSWATVNTETNAPAPVHSGDYSISVGTANYSALYLEHPNFDTSPYASLSFWINGGSSGGQKVQVAGLLDNTGQTAYSLGTLSANTWQQIVIPLSALNVNSKPNFTGIWIQGSVSATQPTFYVDDIQLVAAPAPAVVHLEVNAGQILRTVDARHFGINTATWDGYLGNSQTLPLLEEMGSLTLRWPGGSTSDQYHWASDVSGNATFRNIATNLPGAQVFTTVNYGSGTAAEAAGWVLAANVTNHCGFKYWEIGNECYGTWEYDLHSLAHDPSTYASNAVSYIQQMKAADPSIKVGVVIVPGEDSSVNDQNVAATNSRTGQIHYGWTPVMLATLKKLGVTPDFAIYHFYDEYTPTNWEPNSPDSDALLLQVAGTPSSAWTDWASAAANLRQQISDYMGAAGTNIELVCTENNSDSGAGFGRQLTSIVNGLYLADSSCQLMKTEFNGYLWWDLRNGPNSQGTFDPTIYGWRTYGDEGVINGASGRYPTFYAEKILKYFARPGDYVLDTSSDYLLLSAYAIHRTNGALTMLVINKDATTNFTAQIALNGFVPSANATVQSYGIPQDEAVRTNADITLQDIATTNFSNAGTNFDYSFPPYSLTLFTFSPAAPCLQSSLASNGQLVLQLQGQSKVPYVVQTSADLSTWTSISTNISDSGLINLTNTISPDSAVQFWRAVWQP
ncbi:MAG TPA: alpha-L-arabinofuranosidase [Verrucomicrobiae bacterium]|nr:alpha-L-arabinofuranosidase [Verrucomicrobiae bacterium]